MNRDESLDRLALGSRCPACRSETDEPCRTKSNKITNPHLARIDRAVKQYQQKENS